MQKKILIVTSSRADADCLEKALGDATDGPFKVEWLDRLSRALERIAVGDIDAILVDLMLPDSQGIETFDKLFKADPLIPILTLSDQDDEALAKLAVQRGAQGYLSKGHFSSYLVPQSLRNIIERMAVAQSLYLEKVRAELTLNSISDAVIGTDLQGNVDYLNTAGERMTGWSKEEASGHHISEVMPLINGDTREPVRNPLELVLELNKSIGLSADTVVLRRDASEASIEDSTAPIHDARGRLAGAVMVFHDITASQVIVKKMAHLAQHDFLTNLPNRVLLNDRIAQAIVQAKRRGSTLAVLFLDLDKFKHINDSIGHELGDKLLQSVAKRLSDSVRSSDTVSRLGGDEFLILVSEAHSAVDASLAAEKIITALASPHTIGEHELHITTSIGISIFPGDGDNPETLMQNADTAMYQAKEHGRNNYQFFKDDMNARAIERQVVESSLRNALAREEFVLHYQPKVNLDTGRITGAEALLRWSHPEWGMTQPLRFVQIAEDCGLIVPIGRWVLREACEQVKRWKAVGLNPGTVAVNVSSLEFRHRDFVEGVRSILHETGLAPDSLQLEITESVLMRDVVSTAEVLASLKEMGVELAVDDFGTGYSSLSYLMQFPIDVLKIDQSFVRNIADVENNGIIVSAVISMGNKLKHRVIAEGVEDKVQLAFLKEHRCDEAQGYIFSRPLAADQFASLLNTGLPG
jgi:diguanylate cyclase (GGDEF)-like protein/PAS domain S-box-containing protein